MPEPIVLLVGFLVLLCSGCLAVLAGKVMKGLDKAPSLGDELEELEEQIEPAFVWPPKWVDDAHIELEKRERVGIRGPEFSHTPERVVSARRAA